MEKMITKMYEYWLQNEYPTTIVADRYGGTYSKGGWLAFPLDEIPPEVDGGDIECMEFWQKYKDPVGKGNTPDDALDNLRLQIMQKMEKEVFGDIKRTNWNIMENKTKKVEIEIPVGEVAKWVDGVLTLVDEKPKDVTERIKTFADACRELGSDHPFVNAYNNYISFVHKRDKDDYDVVAYLKLRIITAALNEGWEPQFTKGERRWYFWCDLITKEQYDKLSAEDKNLLAGCGGNFANVYYGLVCAHASGPCSGSYTCHSSRLAFKSEKLADYAGRQFSEIYANFCFKPKEVDSTRQ